MSYIIAHRANGTKYSENSLNAIKEVLKYKYVDGIEIDIRMTKDRKLVLSHNEYILCKNKIKKISSSFYKDIKKCNDIPLLYDVLNEIKTTKYIFLDLKIDKYKTTYKRKLIKYLKKFPNNYYICSFNYKFLKKIKCSFNNYKICLFRIINNYKNDLDHIFIYYKNYKNEDGVWTVNKKDIIKELKEKSIFIITDHPEYNCY